MKKVAVFVPHRAQFGNITTQLPMLYAIKKQYPNVHITIYSKSDNSMLLISTGVADEIINYTGWSVFRIIKSLNSEGFDSVINVYSGSERVHFSVLSSKVENKYAFSNSKLIHKSRLYTKHIYTEKGKQYIANNNIELSNAALGTNFDTTIIKELSKKVNSERTTLTIVPGGGAGEFKVWPIESYCSAAKIIFDSSERVEKISIVLGPQEQGKVDAIRSMLTDYPYEIVQSPPIADLVSLAQSSALTLSNDCGPCHIFQMLKVPIVMIWGWNIRIGLCKSPYHVLTEWYQNSDNSWCVFPDESQKNIASISIDRVSSVALMELGRKCN